MKQIQIEEFLILKYMFEWLIFTYANVWFAFVIWICKQKGDFKMRRFYRIFAPL